LEEALIVNPYDIDDIAHALQQALIMPEEERKARNSALLRRIRARDARNWRESFLATLSPQTHGVFA
jgi:trehalose 6-phosphate synthase